MCVYLKVSFGTYKAQPGSFPSNNDIETANQLTNEKSHPVKYIYQIHKNLRSNVSDIEVVMRDQTSLPVDRDRRQVKEDSDPEVRGGERSGRSSEMIMNGIW